jgi:protein phosphatase
MVNKIEIANVSHVGKRRPHNEDSTLTDSGKGLAILTDGMGGYKAGEVASALAATEIYHLISVGLSRIQPHKNPGSSELTPQASVVKNAIIQANSDIYKTAQRVPECLGMGTTVVVALFHNNKVTIAHVGDSRIYRKRATHFQQITKDHSLIQELVDRGLYTLEEAVATTPKNLVTRALGIDNSVDVAVMEENPQAGDIYLLCSDGLNDMVDDEEIHLTLSKYSANLVRAAEELVSLANAKGGKDNISVILVRILDSFPGNGGYFKQTLSRFFMKSGE